MKGMRLSYKIFGYAVATPNFQFDITSVKNWGKLWAGNFSRNLF